MYKGVNLMDNIYTVGLTAIIAVVGIVAIVYGYKIKELKNIFNQKGENNNEN